jgi:AcrR family transcriptional regulator
MFVRKTANRSITEVRIVEASFQLFSRQGYKGTSTREIASLAAVSEATLFRYFVRKADLFWAVVESRLNRLKLGRELQNGLAKDGDPGLVVPMIVTFLTDAMTQQPQLVRLLYVAAFELPGSERMFREHLGPIFDSLNAYFARCAPKGLTHDFEPTIATLGMAAAVSTHYSLHHMFAGKVLSWNGEETAQAYARFWVNAVRYAEK